MTALKEKQVWPAWKVHIGKDGKLAFQDPDGWSKFKAPFREKDMVLVLKKPTNDRSRQEEKFFHGVVVRMVAEEMGISRESAKELLRGLFLKVEEKSPSGFRYTRLLSTTELGDAAYREFWEQCIRWAAQPTGEEGLSQDSGLGLYIPYPNEVDYENSL